MSWTGDTGLQIAGWYTDGTRRLLCMADHATKGIWLTDPEEDVAITAEEDERANWYGTRAEFDAHGWVLENAAN